MTAMKTLHRQAARSALGLALAAFVIPALAQTPATASPPVARLGAVSISANEVERLLQAMPEAERAQLKTDRSGLENWLRQRLASEQLLREARQQQWQERPEVKARVDAAVREITDRIVSSSYLASVTALPADYPNDAELAAAYEQAKPGLNVPASYRVAQIYLPTPPQADATTTAQVRAEAVKLAAQARKGDFAALAKARSQDARSAAQGGEVGLLPLALMLPEIREPVARLQPNQVSEPVQSPSGFHVLKLLAIQPARLATLEEARPRLQAALREQRQQALVSEYLTRMAPAASVSIDAAALDAALQQRP